MSSRRSSGHVVIAAPAAAALLALALVATSLSCARVAPLPMSGAGGGGGAGSGAGGGSSNRLDGGVRPDAPTPVDLGCNKTVSCTPAGGQYCGIIGDGCTGTIDCGTCPGDQICQGGLCVGGPSCVASTSCTAASGGGS